MKKYLFTLLILLLVCMVPAIIFAQSSGNTTAPKLICKRVDYDQTMTKVSVINGEPNGNYKIGLSALASPTVSSIMTARNQFGSNEFWAYFNLSDLTPGLTYETYAIDPITQSFFKISGCSVTVPGTGGGGTQTGDNLCLNVDYLNYDNCCINATGNAAACKKYTDAGGTDPANDGTVTGGYINTNTQNGALTPPTIINTPQSSSASLTSCNVIAFTSLLDILIWLKCVIGVAIIPLLFTLAFVFFIWGVLRFMYNSDDAKKKEESKKFILYGIIGLVVMIGVWGIVSIVNNTFGFGNTVPTLQTDYLKKP